MSCPLSLVDPTLSLQKPHDVNLSKVCAYLDTYLNRFFASKLVKESRILKQCRIEFTDRNPNVKTEGCEPRPDFTGITECTDMDFIYKLTKLTLRAQSSVSKHLL